MNLASLPEGEDPFLIRTDFSNDQAWRTLVEAVGTPSPDGFLANLTIIDDRRFDGAAADAFIPAANELEHAVLFIADRETLNHPEQPVLCLNLDGSELSFRVIPKELWGVENNLSLANMDPEEFAQAVGEDGVFRGFD